MSRVYFTKTDSSTQAETIKEKSTMLLEKIIEQENIALQSRIPLKVHFGEKGNQTYIKSENFEGMIDYLKEKDVEPSYIETNVLYAGHRHRRDLHLQTAEEHGFTQIPIIIADGDQGEEYTDIKINKKHFNICKIGKAFDDFSQVIVISHFKGHMLAGFGGAIKQLSMGHASKGGKLAMHMGVKPRIKSRKCNKCKLCVKRCNEDAITITPEESFINHQICVGCGACISICNNKAITIFSVKGVFRALFRRELFHERIVEYAYAAQKNKKNIYINYCLNITKGCDCEPKKMKPVMEDFGIFISTDPVSIDKACYDMAKEKGRTFKGHKQLHYAESIGLGSTSYELIEL